MQPKILTISIFITPNNKYFLSHSHPQGIPVTQNVSWGVIISTRSLVLQRVGRNHSGMYACSAANDRGETQSSLVSLRVHCKYKVVYVYDIKNQFTFPCKSTSIWEWINTINVMHFISINSKGIITFYVFVSRHTVHGI